jgi:integrase/recombinase XerD
VSPLPRFSKAQARKILDAPPDDTLGGLRDRAILAVGLQVGFHRGEIAALDVGDLHQNRGFGALRATRKGGRREALAINPQAAQRIRAYLDLAGHGDQLDAPMFRPVRGNAKPLDPAGRRTPTPSTAWCGNTRAESGLARGYSAHSMRATFITTTALENVAQLEDVQKDAGHRDPSTTKPYDRRGYNSEKAAGFFCDLLGTYLTHQM